MSAFQSGGLVGHVSNIEEVSGDKWSNSSET